jgi:hypothetical protein
MRIKLQFAALLFATLNVGGCQLLTHDREHVGKSPLRPAQPSPDSVTMEIIWVRFPANDPQLNSTAWQEIDETQLPPAVRRELASNGFRAGVISGTLPNAIAQALDGDKPPADAQTPSGQAQAASLAAEPIVHGRVQQLQRNQRSEIQASEVYTSLPLLMNHGRELSGRTYREAQAMYALRVDPQPDRSTLVELTPELHHGPLHWGWTRGDDESGILRQAQLRDHEVFNHLRMSLNLAPGEMLVLMSLPDAGSRLGHYFHTVNSSDGPQQKLILIRLADVPPSNTFAELHVE